MFSSMAFAYNYFNISKNEIQGDINVACLTYENVISREESWKNDETIWVLGKQFSLPSQREKFLNFVRSKIWISYRKGFSAIGGTGPTCDTGWGCMLRCGQMMLAQALSALTINQEWEWQSNCDDQPLAYRNILKKLSDDRSSCYSIHQIAQMGVQEGKEVGQWFGPNTIAQSLRRLSVFDGDHPLVIHVAMDHTVVLKDIEKLCTGSSVAAEAEASTSSNPPSHFEAQTGTTNSLANQETSWKPLLLIIPLRLGLSDINPIYFDHLKEVMKWEESVGVIGGKPNHAYFFLGCTEEALAFFDPHTTQPFVKFPDVESGEAFDDATYHCECPSRMLLTQLDPSLAVGFLCATRKQFENICQRVQNFKRTPSSHPLFEVLESFPQCELKETRILTVKSHSRMKRRELKQGREFLEDNTCLALDSDESLESDEEFEILDIQ